MCGKTWVSMSTMCERPVTIWLRWEGHCALAWTISKMMQQSQTVNHGGSQGKQTIQFILTVIFAERQSSENCQPSTRGGGGGGAGDDTRALSIGLEGMRTALVDATVAPRADVSGPAGAKRPLRGAVLATIAAKSLAHSGPCRLVKFHPAQRKHGPAECLAVFKHSACKRTDLRDLFDAVWRAWVRLIAEAEKLAASRGRCFVACIFQHPAGNVGAVLRLDTEAPLTAGERGGRLLLRFAQRRPPLAIHISHARRRHGRLGCHNGANWGHLDSQLLPACQRTAGATRYLRVFTPCNS